MRHKTDQTLSFAPALVNARSPTRVSTCPCQPPRSHAPSTAESSASLTGPHSPFLLQGITLPYTLSALSQATPAGTSQASNSHRQRAMSALEAVLWLQPSPSRRAELLTPSKPICRQRTWCDEMGKSPALRIRCLHLDRSASFRQLACSRLASTPKLRRLAFRRTFKVNPCSTFASSSCTIIARTCLVYLPDSSV